MHFYLMGAFSLQGAPSATQLPKCRKQAGSDTPFHGCPLFVALLPYGFTIWCCSYRRNMLYSAICSVERRLARQFAALSRARLLVYCRRLAATVHETAQTPAEPPCSSIQLVAAAQQCAAALLRGSSASMAVPQAGGFGGPAPTGPPTVSLALPLLHRRMHLRKPRRQLPPPEVQPPSTPGRRPQQAAAGMLATEPQPSVEPAAGSGGLASPNLLPAMNLPPAGGDAVRQSALSAAHMQAANGQPNMAPQTPRKAAQAVLNDMLAPQTPQKAAPTRPAAVAVSSSAAAGRADASAEQAQPAAGLASAAGAEPGLQKAPAPPPASTAAAAALPISEAEALALAAACTAAAGGAGFSWPLYFISTRDCFTFDLTTKVEEARQSELKPSHIESLYS